MNSAQKIQHTDNGQVPVVDIGKEILYSTPSTTAGWEF